MLDSKRSHIAKLQLSAETRRNGLQRKLRFEPCVSSRWTTDCGRTRDHDGVVLNDGLDSETFPSVVHRDLVVRYTSRLQEVAYDHMCTAGATLIHSLRDTIPSRIQYPFRHAHCPQPLPNDQSVIGA